ncbi:hypothetical protein CCR95_01345 [Thiocystis minor]|uniref:hypothetical protein n=1 Tax=Thiocystis minor TaxID=61597 RepID=UPI001911903E|nr:hypothetical protein [Thiocystis minor]MBK5962776.1 hypothetical protein [Thiocystis minor]
MVFYLRRILRAWLTHKPWALLALLPLAMYLVYAALVDVEMQISQDLEPYSAVTPVSASNSPIETVRLGDLLADQDQFFLEPFSLTQLGRKVGLLAHLDAAAMDELALSRLIHANLRLSTLGDSRLNISYRGDDSILGSSLVKFYADRLVQRAADGAKRAKVVQSLPAMRPIGEPIVVVSKTLWQSDRLAPAALVLLLSLIIIALTVALIELLDPSFKSERQIARYLKIPVLGSLPNAEPLARVLRDEKTLRKEEIGAA